MIKLTPEDHLKEIVLTHKKTKKEVKGIVYHYKVDNNYYLLTNEHTLDGHIFDKFFTRGFKYSWDLNGNTIPDPNDDFYLNWDWNWKAKLLKSKATIKVSKKQTPYQFFKKNQKTFCEAGINKVKYLALEKKLGKDKVEELLNTITEEEAKEIVSSSFPTFLPDTFDELKFVTKEKKNV